MESKIVKLANIIVDYSLKVKQGDRVLISCETLEPKPLVKKLVDLIMNRSAYVMVKFIDPDINGLINEKINDNILDSFVKRKEFEVDNFDSYITICYSVNDYIDIKRNSSVISKLNNMTKEIDHVRVNKRKWVLINYPSYLDAYKAKMKSDEFYEYAIDTMTMDYAKMNELIKPLKDLMEKTDKVRIIGPDTDISFSIKGMRAVPCTGEFNIPDGEIFTAPIKDSVNGIITYNTRSVYHGETFGNVRLEFKDGRIVKVSSKEGNQDKLDEIFNLDEGARYIGEFALGFNPMVINPMGDILFDEKIKGSLHFTPGQCYDDANNGNNSMIHWDLVLIQRDDYGGGEIYFDDVLIRKDGKFVLPELIPLNFDNYGKVK